MSDSQQKQAMILWLSNITKQPIKSMKQLINPKYFIKAMNPIIDTTNIDSNKLDGWKHNYVVFKSLIKLLENYVINVLKQSFVERMQAFNIVEMAQGIDQQALYTLLKLVFFICINSPQKQDYISAILQLSQNEQQLFMTIIQENLIVSQQDSVIEPPKKKQLNELYLTLQNLSMENESLQQNMRKDAQILSKLEQMNKKLQQENLKLRKQLLENVEKLSIKQYQQPHQVINENSNQEEILREMRKTMEEQEQQNYKENFRLREKIELLMEELETVREELKVAEQKEFSKNNQKVDHMNCINLKQHQKLVNEQSCRIKQLTQNEWKDKIQKIRLTNFNEELKSKYKKLQDDANERFKKKQEYTLSSPDADQLKKEFFLRIRDSLKKKLESLPNKNNQEENQENQDKQKKEKKDKNAGENHQNDDKALSSQQEEDQVLQKCNTNLKASKHL